jgi:hypothetical protein
VAGLPLSRERSREDDEAGDKEGGNDCKADKEQLIANNDLLEPVEVAGRTSPNSLVCQKTFDIPR